MWAIVVGIDEYVRPSIPKLRYAVADAKLFARALQDVVNVPKDHIYLMTSDAVDENDQPRFVNVAYRLSSLKGKVKKEDTVIFYFAGHGVTLEGEPFLLTEEADNRSSLTLKASSLHGGDLISQLRKNESGNVWVMLDACRNSPNDKEESKLDPAVSSTLSQANVGLSQTATMFSCKVGERAWEWDEKKHGCYSYFLVEGLRRDAADDQGRVTLQRLADYVSEQVPAIAKRFGSSQNPTMFYGGPTAGQWVLATVAPVAAAPKPGVRTKKQDADMGAYQAKLEALQARLDEEKAKRVAAEERAKLAESMRQSAEQRLALLEKQLNGNQGVSMVPPVTVSQVAYTEGATSRDLESEVSRLRKENESLKQRLASLETKMGQVGMSSRSVMLDSQPLWSRNWKEADEAQTRAEKELQANPNQKLALTLALAVRKALDRKLLVLQSGYRVELELRPVPESVKPEIAVMSERLMVQDLLNRLYESRQLAAQSAVTEAGARLKEALLREQKYQEIIKDLQDQLSNTEKELEKSQVLLAATQKELKVANHKLRKYQEREQKERDGAHQTSPELRRYMPNFDQLLEFDEELDLGVPEADELPPR